MKAVVLKSVSERLVACSLSSSSPVGLTEDANSKNELSEYFWNSILSVSSSSSNSSDVNEYVEFVAVCSANRI